jgi:hypothetical protein
MIVWLMDGGVYSSFREGLEDWEELSKLPGTSAGFVAVGCLDFVDVDRLRRVAYHLGLPVTLLDLSTAICQWRRADWRVRIYQLEPDQQLEAACIVMSFTAGSRIIARSCIIGRNKLFYNLHCIGMP